MERAENSGSADCPQRDSTECKGYAGVQSAVRPENGERAVRTPNLLERILNRDNLNNAYKRVKANKGAPGVDGMTVEEALPWLKEHGKELTDSILQGKFKPDPVRRKEIPKPDGGMRKLGIPSVKDRIIQQALVNVLTPFFETNVFHENSCVDMRYYKKSEVINNILTAVFENFTDEQIRDMISRYKWWKNKVETKFEPTQELKPLKRG